MCFFVTLIVDGEQFFYEARMRLKGFLRFAFLRDGIDCQANHEFFCRSLAVVFAY